MENLDVLKLILETGENASGMGYYYVTVMLVDTLLGTIGLLAFLYLIYRLVVTLMRLIPTNSALVKIAEMVGVDDFSTDYQNDLNKLIEKVKMLKK